MTGRCLSNQDPSQRPQSVRATLQMWRLLSLAETVSEIMRHMCNMKRGLDQIWGTFPAFYFLLHNYGLHTNWLGTICAISFLVIRWMLICISHALTKLTNNRFRYVSLHFMFYLHAHKTRLMSVCKYKIFVTYFPALNFAYNILQRPLDVHNTV